MGPESMLEYPAPTEDEIHRACMSAYAKDYAYRKLPKGITPGVHGKWGIGLWCKECFIYVAKLKQRRDSSWVVADAGECPHYTNNSTNAGTENRMECQPLAQDASSLVSADDMRRAILAAQQSKAKTVARASKDQQLLEQID